MDGVGMGVHELLFGQGMAPQPLTNKRIKPTVRLQRIEEDPVAIVNDAADFRGTLLHFLIIELSLFLFHSAAEAHPKILLGHG
jgi:hypothetical protein